MGNPGSLYYRSSIGEVGNLSVGDVMYNDKQLITLQAAATYTQPGITNDDTRYCDTGSVMNMVIGSNGVITSISCV
jgi:hypothetical protein